MNTYNAMIVYLDLALSAFGSFSIDKLFESIVWIGLIDEGSEGKFSWSDGTPVNYTQWYDEEPNSYMGLEVSD